VHSFDPRHDRADCIVRRVPHLFVGLEKALATLAEPGDGAHGVSPVALRSLYHLPLPLVGYFQGVFKCVAQSMYI
jgi:hypothetical protein